MSKKAKQYSATEKSKMEASLITGTILLLHRLYSQVFANHFAKIYSQ